MSLEVVKPGPLSLVQDAGRPGLAAIGVSPSGVADRTAFAAGAVLVGNDPVRHAAVEITLGGLSVKASVEVTVALTGAECPAVVDGRPVAWGKPIALGAGALLTLGPPRTGLRSYLSVAGGIDVPPVLGSRSTDILSDIGPPRLVAGMVLPVDATVPEPDEGRPTVPEPDEGPPTTVPEPDEGPPTTVPEPDEGPPTTVPEPDEGPPTTVPEPDEGPARSMTLELLPGPRTDWLADPAALAGDWTVSPNSNRVGVRLTGTRLERAAGYETAELPSEPLVRGAVQLPPSGQPVVFGPDHPTTGGYPVVAVLTEAASDRLAQCRPGDAVQLTWATPLT